MGCNIELLFPGDDVSVEGRAKIILFNLHNVLTLDLIPFLLEGTQDLFIGSSRARHILVINALKQT